MAVITNTLGLDIKPFMKGVKEAIGASEELGEPIKIRVDGGDVGGELTQEFSKADGAVKELTGDVGLLNDSLGEAGKSGGLFSESFSKLKGGDVGGAFSGLTAGIGAALPQLAVAGAAIGAVGAAFSHTYELGHEFEKQLKSTSLATGLTGEALEKLGKQADDAFTKGVGESSADAVQILGKLKQSLGDAINTEDLGDAAIKATALGKALQIEAPDLIDKIGPLMKQMGLDYEEALNLVAGASQNGIADMGGYLDAINEFTPSAKAAGLSAQEFGGLLERAGQQGLKDFGKLGDGIKEVQIRINNGDLQAQLSQFGGEIGTQLQSLAKLGQEGALQGKEVLQQSVAAIDKEFQEGKISESVRAQLLATFGGTVVEDIGTEAYSKIFSAPIDEAAISEKAKKAGKLIEDAIPPVDLGKVFENVQKDIGLVFVQIKEKVLDPLIRPIIEAFTQIKQAFTDAFSGEGASGMGDALKVVTDILSGVLGVALNQIVNLFKILFAVGKAIFDGIQDAVTPVIDLFADLFSGAGEGVDIFDTLKGVTDALGTVIKTLLVAPIKLLAGILKFVVEATVAWYRILIDAAKAVYGFATSFEPLNKAVTAIIDNVIKVGKAVGDFLSRVGSALGLVDKPAEKTAEAIDAVGDASDEASDATKNLAKDVNALAQAFNQSLTNAQGQLALFISAQAGAKGYATQIRNAASALRKLEEAQDRASLIGDPKRQQAINDQIANATRETKRAAEELTAGLIVNAEKRNAELLRIQQKYDTEALDAQIKSQRAIIAVGGAGVPEAQAALKDLQQQRLRLTAQNERDISLLQGQEQTARLERMVRAEQLTKDALEAIGNERIAQLQRNVDAFSEQDVDKLVAVSVSAIERQTQAQVRALVEATPDFEKASKEISESLNLGLINADEADAQLKKLRQSIEDNLRATAGDANPLGEQLNAILSQAERQAADTARAIRDNALDASTALIRSDIIRGIEEQVRGLEKQRDLLLLNTNLTAEQRKNIEDGFATAIDKTRKGALTGLQQSLYSVRDTLLSMQFDLGADEAVEDINNVLAANEALIESFKKGEITYQQALAGMQTVTESQASFLSSLGESAKKTFQAVADAQSEAVQSALATVRELLADQEKVTNDTTLSATEKEKQLGQISEKIAQQQGRVIEQIEVQAGSSLVNLIAQGENVGTALKQIAGDTVKSLVALYTPSIIALFQSVIPPPFGTIAAGVAIASLQALISAALAGFKDGGFTGTGGDNDVAGVVHKNEFVAPSWMAREHSDLLAHLYAKKPLEAFPSIQQLMTDNSIVIEPPAMNVQSQQIVQQQLHIETLTSEVTKMRKQLEGMDTLQRSAQQLEVFASPDTTIKLMRETNLRNLSR